MAWMRGIASVFVLQIWVRKTSDSTKMRIYLGQLQRGAFVIRRRSAAWNMTPPPPPPPTSAQLSIHPPACLAVVSPFSARQLSLTCGLLFTERTLSVYLFIFFILKCKYSSHGHKHSWWTLYYLSLCGVCKNGLWSCFVFLLFFFYHTNHSWLPFSLS